MLKREVRSRRNGYDAVSPLDINEIRDQVMRELVP